MFYLKFPDISHKARYLDMIREWGDFEEIPMSPRALFRGDNFEEFIDITEKNKEANSLGVPATLFFFMDNEEILGALQLRHHIDHPNCSLEGRCGGHIGYGLRPSSRGKGLAKEMLRLGLEEARRLGIGKVLISAHTDNTASWKTIESCGGEFVKEVNDEGQKLKVYLIPLQTMQTPPSSPSPISPSENPTPSVAPSRKAIRSKIRADKMKEKIDRKAAFRRKTEKKLAEKAERKVYHKKENAQKKFQAKIQAKKTQSKR